MWSTSVICDHLTIKSTFSIASCGKQLLQEWQGRNYAKEIFQWLRYLWDLGIIAYFLVHRFLYSENLKDYIFHNNNILGLYWENMTMECLKVQNNPEMSKK